MAVPNYRDIVELIKKGATYEAQEQIMLLREETIRLQEENLLLRQKISDLDTQLKIREQLTYDGSTYWLGAGDFLDGPYCQRCQDADDRLVRLQDYGDVWYCLNCEQSHTKRSGR